MIIKIFNQTQYEVESAKMIAGRIVSVRADGTEIIIGGDLSDVEVIGGEIENGETAETVSWDAMAAGQTFRMAAPPL